MARTLAMFTDTSLCIGCRACQVACKQWNELGLEVPEWTGGYQNHAHFTDKTFRLVRFIEEPGGKPNGDLAWLLMSDVCKHCAQAGCLDACPTGAFVEPHVLDARRCLAYLTIEHRGDIPDEWKPAMSEWLFGCDVCQDVCPWNRKAPTAREPALAPSASLPSLEALLAMDEEAFRARFRGSAMSRAKRAGLARNAALLLGNRGERAAVPALRRALSDPDEGVRRAAAWALSRCEG